MNKFKKGDHVIILKGKDQGKAGEILTVIPETQKVVVDKINVRKKHAKPTQNSKGGILDIEAPIHWSNVALIDPDSKKATRVSFSIKNKKKERVFVSSGKSVG